MRFLMVLLLSCGLFNAYVPHSNAQPYPNSTYITGITWNLSSYVRLAPGSDNWPITWADDDHQYTNWGDGGGFGGTNQDGRSSLGFGRVEGDWDNYTTFNVWGGKNPENPKQFGGKSYGMISVDGVIYAWWGHNGSESGGQEFIEATLPIKSTNHCASFTKATWKWTKADNLYGPTFLNFGKDNAGARDNYVYSYFPRGDYWKTWTPGKADLARVPKDQIMTQSAYEWVTGFDGNGNPQWSSTLTARQPVFVDPKGFRVVGVSYNKSLNRYLLTAAHGSSRSSGDFTVYEGLEPWGPWTTITYISSSWQFDIGLLVSFAPKWFSADGKDFSLVFTSSDGWSTVRGRFTVANLDSTPPTAPTSLAASPLSDSEIKLTWSAASDAESGISRYLIYRNGSQISTSDVTTFTDQGLSEATTYSYEVSAENGGSLEGPKTSAAQATTQADQTPPTIVSVTASSAVDKVVIVFSEPVEQASAQTTGNYAIDNSITVTAASLGTDGKTVTLTTFAHTEGITYTLTVNNVQDRASTPNTIAANSKKSYTYVGQLVISNTTVTSGKAYVWGVIESPITEKNLYIDRAYTFTTIDPVIEGYNYLKTANDDKGSTGNSFLSFDINVEADVYLAVASTSALSWMIGWENTGKTVVGRGLLITYTLFKKVFPAGIVTLGGNEGTGGNMYVVFAASSSGTVVAYNHRQDVRGTQEIYIIAAPNPFHQSTMIMLGNNGAGWSELAIYDIHGDLVTKFQVGDQNFRNTISWDAGSHTPGIYYVIGQVAGKRLVKRVILLQ